jgi:hypothetical protein
LEQEYTYGNSCNRWISRNRIAFSKYIKQNQVPAADAEINGFAKVFTINIMLMHMTLFSLKQLTVYQDSLEIM